MRAISASFTVEGKRVRRIVILEDKNCEICDSAFKPKRRDSKFCSQICTSRSEYLASSEKSKERSKKYYKENTKKLNQQRKKRYWKDPEKYRAETRVYWAKHPKQKKQADAIHKDKTRHGGRKKELIDKNGLVCSRCDKNGDSFEIVAHHITHDPLEHDYQELLCRACHLSEHRVDKSKPLSKEDILNALKNNKGVIAAAKSLRVSRSHFYKQRLLNSLLS